MMMAYTSRIAAAIAVLFLSSGTLLAGVVTDSPALPPNDGVYRTASDVHAEFSGPDLLIVLKDILHKPIADRAGITIETIDADEIETFDTTLNGSTLTTSVALGLDNAPDTISLLGPMVVRSLGKAGNTTGAFDTEILSMDLAGTTGSGIPVLIRLAPSPPSTGRTTITDLGGGQWQIDSFFDVFTELVLDPDGVVPVDPTNLPGVMLGPLKVPQISGATRVTLVPEPGSMALATFGLLGLLSFARRRRRQTT